MDQEIALLRALHLAKGLPVRGEPPAKEIAAPEVMSMRRALRTMTDGLLADGLIAGSALTTGRGIAATMMSVAGPLVALGLTPNFSEFVAGTQRLIAEARDAMDKGLTAHDWEQVRVGATMLGTVCVGLSDVLGMPYLKMLESMVHAQLKDEPDTIETLLIEAGVLSAPAANDG